jgi:hypothetical protein
VGKFKMKGFSYPGGEYTIKESKIHGKGAFSKKDIKKGDKIGDLIDKNADNPTKGENRTTLGKHVNHESTDNSKMNRKGNKWELRATKNIKKNKEITTNYKKTPWFVDKNTSGFNKNKTT